MSLTERQDCSGVSRACLVLGTSVCFFATLLLRGARIGRPGTLVFDEIFYANDALDLVTNGAERSFVAHPPLGKWLIGAGIRLAGFDPVGWRLGPLVAGALVVALTFLAAARITRSLVAAYAAGALVMLDGIAHVTGRYAMLDGFTALFTTAILLVLVWTPRSMVGYRTAALLGVLGGAALASKWSAGPVLVVAFIVVVRRVLRDGGMQRAAVMAAVMVGVTIGTYTAAYAPWLVAGPQFGNCVGSDCSSGFLARLALLPSIQEQLLEFSVELPRQRDNVTPGWRWLIQDRATRLVDAPCREVIDALCEDQDRSTVTIDARGNAVLWLATIPAVASYLWRRRRGSYLAGSGLALSCSAALWLPWIPFGHTFTFYAAPIVPALAIAVATTLAPTPARRDRAIAIALVTGAAVAFTLSRETWPWLA